MNELTWRKVQQWEALHPETHSEATLLRFCGRPDELRCSSFPLLMVRQPWENPAGLLDPPRKLARACPGAPGKFQAFLVLCTCLPGQAL